jgi:hypothetical protein
MPIGYDVRICAECGGLVVEGLVVTVPKVRIDKIVIVHEMDTNPDASYLGEYTSEPGLDGRTIDRKKRGDAGQNEYRCFVAEMSGEETGNPGSVEQDYQRMESLQRGDWYLMGIQAKAELSYDIGQGNRRIERMQSGGLWGIESDSDADYIVEIEQNELMDLRSHLEVFGVDCSNFDELAEKAARKEK